jgi:FkbM family methyltransferase
VAKALWTTERHFFYPKLAAIYKDLSLSAEGGNRMIIFDIGANRGQSVRFFKSLYPSSKIYTFEPSESSFKKLRSFVTNMQYSGVFLFRVAFGDSQREAIFHESDLSETSSFVLPNQDSKYLKKKNRILFQKNENSYNSIPIQITTLDDFVNKNEINFIDIVKIDVEGFELEVIQGASNTLEQGLVQILQIENQDNDMRRDNFHEINSFLRERNYFSIKEISHPFGNFREILYQKQ